MTFLLAATLAAVLSCQKGSVSAPADPSPEEEGGLMRIRFAQTLPETKVLDS